MKNTLAGIIASAVLVIGISPALQATDNPDPFLRLLEDAQARSSQLSLEWKSCAKQPALDWAGAAPGVTQMKGDLTAVIHTADALDETRGQASPAQLAAMDRIVPVVREIAENTAKAIDFLARNQTRLTGKQYKDYLDQSSDTSGRLSTLVSQLVDYEGRRAKLELAKRNLELAAK